MVEYILELFRDNTVDRIGSCEIVYVLEYKLTVSFAEDEFTILAEVECPHGKQETFDYQGFGVPNHFK